VGALGQRLVAQRGVLLELIQQADVDGVDRDLFHKKSFLEIYRKYYGLMKFYFTFIHILI
jgi:hypothetical protein